MKRIFAISIAVLLVPLSMGVMAQTGNAPEESPWESRYSLGVIDDATFYANPQYNQPAVQNQLLIEPTGSLRYRHRWTFSTSLIGDTTTYTDTATKVHVREAYVGLSAGNFDFTAGRKLVRWGTGYAFTAAGVLDPPKDPTNPTDRLNENQGRDMVKADWVHGKHAMTLAWSTGALAPDGTDEPDTTAFRYNVLVHGFDTALIAGHDRASDTFGGLTFTRVLGQAWELHGESMWREGEAFLMGAKYTMRSGVTFIGEFYTPPNTSYYRDPGVSPTAGRQNYAFLYAGKTRLRELPGWKEWDVSGSIVMNLNDHSCTAVYDVSRWFGKHFSAYVHGEVPAGSKTSQYGSTPYSSETSVGIRFHL